MSYEKSLEIVEGLVDKRFIKDLYKNGSDRCVIGALFHAVNIDLSGRIGIADYGERDKVKEGLKELGLTLDEAEVLQGFNDCIDGDRGDRYTKVLKWLKKNSPSTSQP